MEMKEGSQKGRKHWEKEKCLFTSNFSFSHSVFKFKLELSAGNKFNATKKFEFVLERVENNI